jgi:tricorn protease-like protein
MVVKKLSRFSTTTIHSDSYVFITRKNKVIIYFDGYDSENFIDVKGSAAFNFSSSVFQTSQKKFDEYPIGAHLDFLSFSPNGNIIAASVCKFNSDKCEFYFSDIYLVNRSGKMTKLTNTKDKKELVLGWSPQGNKIIYCDSRDVCAYFEDALTKYYMINLIKK